jgi:hypothetical protein
MINGNAFDTYTVLFSDGEQFSLMATTITMAKLMAKEIHPIAEVVAVFKEKD